MVKMTLRETQTAGFLPLLSSSCAFRDLYKKKGLNSISFVYESLIKIFQGGGKMGSCLMGTEFQICKVIKFWRSVSQCFLTNTTE